MKRISFTIAGRLGLGDEFRYLDPFVYCTTQYGFLRANVDTGEVIVRAGISYNNPIFPPSDIGVNIVGDYNNSVTQIAVNETWIVTDNIASATVPKPAAVVWRADLSFHGFVPLANPYFWHRGTTPIIIGDEVHVTSGDGLADVFNARTLRWFATGRPVPQNPAQGSLRGYTYRWSPLDGSGQHEYELVRSDVATEPIPAPSPTPPPAPQPPPTEEPSMPPTPTPDVSQPCPEGQFRVLVGPDAGKCMPIGGTAPTPVPAPSPVTPKIIRLHGGRFNVEADFEVRGGIPTKATPVGITDDAAWFWFFTANNPEILVKVVGDAEKPWVFAGGLTDVKVRLTVTDQQTGKREEYVNEQGTPFQPIQDTSAFAA